MKILQKRILVFFVITEIILLPLFSCSKGDEEKAQKKSIRKEQSEEITIAERDEQIKESEILTPVKRPEEIEGIVTYYSGDVRVFEEKEWYDIEIGDLVTEKNTLKVGNDSFCEVQFGNTAVVKIQENSEVDLAKVSLEPGNAEVSLDMKLGNVLCKVQKLTGNESFKVKTQTAVCGVRGTEFSVLAEKANTTLAVKKGAVAILPKSVDIDELKGKLANSSNAVKEAIRKIEESAPLVKANKEIKLDTKVIEKTKTAAKKIEKAVEEAALAKTPEEEEKIAKKLNKVIKEQKQELIKNVEKPREISEENVQALKQVDNMKMIAIAPATGKAEGKTDEPSTSFYKVSINSLTKGAEIRKDGKLVSKDNYYGIFKEGELLKFNITKEGYEPYNMEFKVSKTTARLYKIGLNKLSEPEKKSPVKEISFTTVPDTSEIFINEEKKGTGNFKGVFKEGEELSVKISNKGYNDKLLKIMVDEKTKEEYKILLEKGLKEVTIKTLPKDSSIIHQGKNAGKGKASFNFKYGESALIKIRRNGYKERTLKLNIDKNTKSSYTIKLRAKPVEMVLSPFKNPVIKEISYQNGRFFAADAGGNIYSAKINGKSAWKYASGNTENANSAPVAAGKYVFITGAKEMVVLDAATGKLNNKKTLGQASAHMFGRSIIPFKDKFIYPENKVLRIGTFIKGSPETKIPLPSDSGMSAAVWKSNIVIADMSGKVNIIDPSSRKITGIIATSAIQPIALGITVSNDKGFFANRKGKVAAVDLALKKLLWEKEIKEEKINVFTNLSVNKNRIFVFTGKKIHVFKEKDGSEAFPPIQASSPPLCKGNLFYAGKPDGKLGIYNCITGKEIKTINLDYGIIKTRPASAGDMILAGTDKGKIIVLNSEGFGL